MKLSDHFDLSEFTVSQTAERRGIDNTPSPEIVQRLKVTAGKLDAIRAHLGHPVVISSGYRCATLNRVIGGAVGSAHVLGWAADFICPGYGNPLAICKAIKASGFAFDQVIEEGAWVHISFDPRMRGQLLTKTAGGYATGIAA
jgi:zinc D-Ala-D-Ala carboxypeptidase